MRNKTYKKGGKYLGKGAYGCTFTKPPLKCKNEESRRNNTHISKVFVDKNAANIEMEESALWKDIDPDQDFSLYGLKQCNLNSENIKAANEFEKCKLPLPANNQKPMLLSKFGGIDLQKLNPISSNYLKLFKSFVPLLKGLEKAHDAKLAHCDIKEENIVAEVQNSKIILRFIDFGLSIKTKNMVEMPDVYLNETYYYYWPFEFGCFDTEGNLYSYASVEKRYEYIQNRKYKSLRQVYPVHCVTAPNIDISKLYEIYNSIGFKDFENNFEKLDIYSFGIMLLKIVYKYFKVFVHEDRHKNTFIAYDIKNKIYTEEDFLNNIPNNDQRNWNIEVHDKIVMPLLEICEDMVSIVRFERKSLNIIINKFEKLFPDMEKYLSKNEVLKGLSGYDILNHELPDRSKTTTPKRLLKIKSISPKKK
jgi:serine/threonine protein kinase